MARRDAGDDMDRLERVLTERADELAEVVRSQTGLSAAQARRFVEDAAGDVVAALEWQAGHQPPLPMDSPGFARNVLEGIPGRAVAERVGLPPIRAWDGLRALVSAALRTAAGEPPPEA